MGTKLSLFYLSLKNSLRPGLQTEGAPHKPNYSVTLLPITGTGDFIFLVLTALFQSLLTFHIFAIW